MRRHVPLLVALTLLPAAQAPAVSEDRLPLPPVPAGSRRWLLSLESAPIDLSAVHRAVRAGDAAGLARAIARLRSAAEQRVARLVPVLPARGGVLVRSFWLVPVCVVDLPEATAVGLAALPGVTAVRPDAGRRPW